MSLDRDDWAIVAGIVGVLALVAGIVSLIVWYEGRYPCQEYNAVYHESYTSFETTTQSCGKHCVHTITVPRYHPAWWEQRCMRRGDSTKGDVQAAYAPIPPNVAR